jgi:hypothetical protein
MAIPKRTLESESLQARLDEVRMSPVERDAAKAQLLAAETVVNGIADTYLAVRGALAGWHAGSRGRAKRYGMH